MAIKYFFDEVDANDKEREARPVRLCNSHEYTNELSSPSWQAHMHNAAFKGRMFDQGCDSTHKTSDPLTVNVSMYPTAVIVSRGPRVGGDVTVRIIRI